MTITIDWDDDKRELIHIQFERDWVWEDIYDVYWRISDLLEGVNYNVQVIIDVAHIVSIRKGLNMRKVQESVQQNHPRTDFVVIYNASPIVVPIVNTLLRATKNYQLTTARDEAEAREMVAAYRAKV